MGKVCWGHFRNRWNLCHKSSQNLRLKRNPETQVINSTATFKLMHVCMYVCMYLLKPISAAQKCITKEPHIWTMLNQQRTTWLKRADPSLTRQPSTVNSSLARSWGSSPQPLRIGLSTVPFEIKCSRAGEMAPTQCRLEQNANSLCAWFWTAS